ncbi:MAG TPA: LuxR C-terminal-related transcriptional regulator [Patescibacteria group bacterium]|nr:LuxR C-terminal-related transcriptional regulator [Patescibacteria group bacterium]
MAGPLNTESRAALRNNERVRVAIASPSGQTLRLLIASGCGSRASSPVGEPSAASARTLDPWSHPPHPAPPAPVRLTARELQVLKLIAEGLHNRQIAVRIHRSIKTVEKHRQNLHTKLSTHEVAGLTRYALSVGLMQQARSVQALARAARQLTRRELEILKLVAQGSGNKWIASELHRSIKTVDHHRENIMKKLGVHEVAGLTRFAVWLGLM